MVEEVVDQGDLVDGVLHAARQVGVVHPLIMGHKGEVVVDIMDQVVVNNRGGAGGSFVVVVPMYILRLLALPLVYGWYTVSNHRKVEGSLYL